MAMNIYLHFGGYNKTVTWGSGPAVTPNLVAHIDTWPCVPDQVRGYYEFNGKDFVPVSKPNHYKRIALIVESPHQSEFDANFCPIAPLNGRSGGKFATNILTKLNLWFAGSVNNGDCFEIYIMNPVQYQTSLHHFLNGMIAWEQNNNYGYNKIDKKLRDDVWEFLFVTCGLKTTFISRLQAYGPDYIINCCTGGNNNAYGKFNTINQVRRGGASLKAYVKNEIIRAFQNQNNVQYLQHKHPISWP